MQKEQQIFKTFVESKVVKSNDLPVTPQKQILPLISLDWKLFEHLCCRLIAHEPDTEGIPYLYGVPGEDQKGIDIVTKKQVSGNLQTWCYQCKDYQDFSLSDFKQAINALEYKADHYVFLIACEAKTGLQDIAGDSGAEIWDVRIISSKLKYHPDLVSDFFGLAWKNAFCIPQETINLTVLDIYRPPKPKQPFIGREAELDILHQQLSKQRVIIIEGIGGIGKTEILLQALEKIHDIPAIWLDVESYETLSDLKQALLRAFSKEGLTLGTEKELFAYLDKTTTLKQIDKMSSSYRPYALYWTFLYEVCILLEVAKYIGQISSSNGDQEKDRYITMIYDLCEDLHEPFSDRVFKWLEKLFSKQ